LGCFIFIIGISWIDCIFFGTQILEILNLYQTKI
jgi:hypothetical protein